MLRSRIPPLVLLAAGKSSRFGSPKGLRNVDGEIWINLFLSSYLNVGASKMCIVLGHDAEKYRDVLEKNFKNLKIVINHHPELGQFSSLQAGLKLVLAHDESAHSFFISTVDTGIPKQETWQQLTQIDPKYKAIVPIYQGKGGHPVRISRSFAKHLSVIDLSDPKARLDVQIHSLPAKHLLRPEITDDAVVENRNLK